MLENTSSSWSAQTKMLGTPCQRCGVDSPQPPGAQQPRCNKHSANRGTTCKKRFCNTVALKNDRDERRPKPDMRNENTEEDGGTSGLHQSSNVRSSKPNKIISTWNNHPSSRTWRPTSTSLSSLKFPHKLIFLHCVTSPRWDQLIVMGNFEWSLTETVQSYYKFQKMIPQLSSICQ